MFFCSSPRSSFSACTAVLSALCLTPLLPQQARASGFALEDGTARGNIIPAEMTAKGVLPSSLYFNPATITALEGTQIEFGFTNIRPSADIHATDPYTGTKHVGYGEGRIWTLPNAYVTHQINDSLWFGFGMFVRYGLGAEFKDTWAGRYNSYKVEIQSLDFNPNIAWRVNDRLSVSAGISLRYFDVELNQKIDAAGAFGLRPYNNPAYSPYDVDQHVEGDDIAPAIDLGLTYKLTDTLTFGAAYHSRTTIKAEGKADWTVPPMVAMAAPGYFQDTKGGADITTPDKIMLSLAWDASKKLTLSAGVSYTTWSTYDELTIELENPMMPGRDKLSSKKDWNDTFRLSFGADYALTDTWRIYGGYSWDQAPLNSYQPDYIVPGDNRHIFGIGTALTYENWTLDASYFYEIVEDFDVKGNPAHGTFNGKFKDADAHVTALSLSRKF